MLEIFLLAIVITKKTQMSLNTEQRIQTKLTMSKNFFIFKFHDRKIELSYASCSSLMFCSWISWMNHNSIFTNPSHFQNKFTPIKLISYLKLLTEHILNSKYLVQFTSKLTILNQWPLNMGILHVQLHCTQTWPKLNGRNGKSHKVIGTQKAKVENIELCVIFTRLKRI